MTGGPTVVVVVTLSVTVAVTEDTSVEVSKSVSVSVKESVVNIENELVSVCVDVLHSCGIVNVFARTPGRVIGNLHSSRCYHLSQEGYTC
jgi:hypothetical protein